MGNARSRADAVAVMDSVRRYRDRLTELADPVRVDEPDSVHQMRVATRRLRSVIGTYPSVFPITSSGPIRDELRWLGVILGYARDEEVLADRFGALLRAQPPQWVRGPVRHRLVDAHDTEYAAAHAAAVEALDGPRFRDLLAALDDLCARSRPASAAAVADSLRTALRRVRRAGRNAGISGSERPDRQVPPELVHAVRKRAKALRYAAEAVAASRPKAARIAAAAAELQTVLGEHQDAAVAQRHLLTAADRARAAGEDTFTYGLLTALEDERARVARAAAHDRLRAVRTR